MRVLITGGAGFLGSHLSERLLNDGHQVIILDNFFTGSKTNIQHLLGNQNFELIRHDVIDPIRLEVDKIYNFACPASPPHYQYNAVKTIKTSFLGTINMLELAKAIDARILQSSTSEVYGNPLEHPQTEEYWGNVNPIGPRACYDEGKRIAETLCFDYYRQYQLDIRVIRIFNTYGPRMLPDDGRVVSNFIVQALQGKDLTVYGTGMQTRSFCFVDDLISGMILFMEHESDTRLVNLGNPTEFTVLELAEKILNKVKGKSKIIHQIALEDDPQQRQPNINRVKNLLNWQPIVSLDEGLDRTIEHFRHVLKIS